jgi:predicted Holliday junction resolvase-like endonuclease
MKRRIVICVLALLVVVLMAGCGPSESAIATAIAQTEAVESAIEQETQTAEAMILEKTASAEMRAKETEQAEKTAEAEELRIVKETEQAIVGLTQTVEAVIYEQTQAAIPRDCTPGGVFVDFEGDANDDMVDILKVETSLDGEELTVVMYVKSLPEEISINEAEKGLVEFSWAANIDVDNDPTTGAQENYHIGTGLEYGLSLFHFSWGSPQTGPIEQILRDDATVMEFIDGGTSMVSFGTMSVDYENNSLTFKGRVPGINEESRLYFVTGLVYDDDTLCD